MSRRALAVIAAILIGIAGTTTVVMYARQADARALAGQEAVRVFVVTEEIPAGTTAAHAVEEGLMHQQLIARKAVPEDALTEVGGGYGELVATASLQPGSLVMRPSFAAKAATEGALPIPQGKFAVSIALDDPGHVGAFVTVGSHVAIFDTFNLQETDKKATSPAGDRIADRHEFTRATRLLLADIEVLAVGATSTAQVASGDDDDGQPAASSGDQRVLFTVAVTQAEAERLIHVARTGTASFALIGAEATAEPGPGTDDRRLFLEGK